MSAEEYRNRISSLVSETKEQRLFRNLLERVEAETLAKGHVQFDIDESPAIWAIADELYRYGILLTLDNPGVVQVGLDISDSSSLERLQAPPDEISPDSEHGFAHLPGDFFIEYDSEDKPHVNMVCAARPEIGVLVVRLPRGGDWRSFSCGRRVLVKEILWEDIRSKVIEQRYDVNTSRHALLKGTPLSRYARYATLRKATLVKSAVDLTQPEVDELVPDLALRLLEPGQGQEPSDACAIATSWVNWAAGVINEMPESDTYCTTPLHSFSVVHSLNLFVLTPFFEAEIERLPREGAHECLERGLSYLKERGGKIQSKTYSCVKAMLTLLWFSTEEGQQQELLERFRKSAALRIPVVKDLSAPVSVTRICCTVTSSNTP